MIPAEFERVMFMKSKVLLVITALCASLAIGLLAAGCGDGIKTDVSTKSTLAASKDDATANPPKSEPDTDAFQKIAVKACVDSAARESVPEGMAQGYCDCAIDELLQKLDSSQIADIALSGDTALPPDVEEELANAVLACMDKLIRE
jgi:hypothetical protein